MVPMLSPDGQVGDVPHDRVGEAVKAGFKVGQEMTSPDGKAGVIPVDSVHDAIHAGFQMVPPGMPAAPNAIQEEINNRAANPMAGFPGDTTGAPHMANDKELAAASGLIGAAGLTVGAPVIGTAAASPAGKELGKIALKKLLGGTAFGLGMKYGSKLIPPSWLEAAK